MLKIRKMRMRILRNKVMGIFGGLSLGSGILGSFAICHNICLGIIAFLGLFGITLLGMPFAGFFQFLEKYNTIFLSIGAVSLLLSLGMYVKHRRMKK